MTTMLIPFEPILKHVLYIDICRNCGRYIKTDRVKIHEATCRKMTQARVFNVIYKEKTSLEQSEKDDKRKQFQNLMESIRQRGYIIDVSLPPPSIQSDYIQCLNCLRRFNSDAAHCHIPKCPFYEYNKIKPSKAQKSKMNHSKFKKE